MLELDTRFECDGHLLLDALALSAAFQTPFRMDDIRAFEEKKKGMRPHQDAAISLVRDMTNGHATYNRNSVEFSPGPLRAGDFIAEVDGAGPISSVLQAALLPAVLAPGPVTMTIVGGTDVLYRPNFAYVEKVLLPYYRKFATVTLKVEKRGIFPRGNGRVIVKVSDQKLPTLPNLEGSSTYEKFHLQVIGSAAQSAEILEIIQQSLPGPVELDLGEKDLNVFSLCLWAEVLTEGWPHVLGSWRVGDTGVTPKFGTKLVNEFLDKLSNLVQDPRAQLLGWLAGIPMPETTTADSNELAATKYLFKALQRT